jgi:flagellar biosynthetic protein FliR
MIAFNPLLSRRNMPMQYRMGFVLALTVLLAGIIDNQALTVANDIELIFAVFKELLIGYACGFVFQIFYYFLFFVGDLLDVQFGLSMAKVFDPATNIQMAVTSNLLSFVFVLFIFATDSHLILIKIFAASFEIVPLMMIQFSPIIADHFIELFGNIFTLALRLAMPFVVTQFIVEVSLGILMKLVPQIHVFVISIQMKMLLGILLLLLFAQPIAAFLDNYTIIMLQNMEGALHLISGSFN